MFALANLVTSFPHYHIFFFFVLMPTFPKLGFENFGREKAVKKEVEPLEYKFELSSCKAFIKISSKL